MTNTTLTVTNNPVEISEGATGTQPDTEDLDTSGNSDGSGGGNEAEESLEDEDEA